MTAPPPIAGRVEFDLLDFLAADLRRFLYVLFGFLAFDTLAAPPFWIWVSPQPEIENFIVQPAATFWRMASEIWPLPLAPLALIPIFVAVTALRHARLPAANRRIRYEIDADRLVTADDAGFRLEMPWKAVTHVKVGRRLLTFRAGTLPRYVMKRAFRPAEIEQIVAWAHARGG